MPTGDPGKGQEKKEQTEPVTSESVKNAHAAGDGAIERSLDSIPDEEVLKKDNKGRSRRSEQY